MLSFQKNQISKKKLRKHNSVFLVNQIQFCFDTKKKDISNANFLLLSKLGGESFVGEGPNIDFFEGNN